MLFSYPRFYSPLGKSTYGCDGAAYNYKSKVNMKTHWKALRNFQGSHVLRDQNHRQACWVPQHCTLFKLCRAADYVSRRSPKSTAQPISPRIMGRQKTQDLLREETQWTGGRSKITIELHRVLNHFKSQLDRSDLPIPQLPARD